MLEKQQIENQFTAQFRPSAEQLRAIAQHGQELLVQATDDDLGSFIE